MTFKIVSLGSTEALSVYLDSIRTSVTQRVEASKRSLDSALNEIEYKTNSRREKATRETKQYLRLTHRLESILAMRSFFQADPRRQFLGILGWGKNCEYKVSTGIGFSQFDTIVYLENGEKKLWRLDSSFESREYTASKQFSVSARSHGHHFHTEMIPNQELACDIRFNEGCACCASGQTIDCDEAIGALNEIMHSSHTSESTELVHPPDFDASHIGVSVGLVTPLAIMGLTAAHRNLTSSWSTRKKVNALLKGLEKDIARAKRNNPEVIASLLAFRDTLRYSLIDAHWNFWISGVLNGTTSGSMLVGIFESNPFTLLLLSAYSYAQSGRSVWEIVRAYPRKISDFSIIKSTISELKAVKKINAIRQSKLRFYTANALGFAAFGTGALLTVLSLPAFAVFGAGAVTLPIGISLLLLGASITGIGNNIWPRKFRPRNGNIGIKRHTVRDSKQLIPEIGKRVHQKSQIKQIRDRHYGLTMGQRFKIYFWKLIAAFPFTTSISSKKIANIRFNRLMVNPMAPEVRNNLLENLVQSDQDDRDFFRLHHENRPWVTNWILLEKLNLQNQIILEFYKRLFEITEIYRRQMEKLKNHAVSNHGHAHGHHHAKNNDELAKELQKYEAELLHFPGLSKSDGNVVFDLNQIASSNLAIQKLFIASMDYVVLEQHRATLKYQQYGLIDYYWALNFREKK